MGRGRTVLEQAEGRLGMNPGIPGTGVWSRRGVGSRDSTLRGGRARLEDRVGGVAQGVGARVPQNSGAGERAQLPWSEDRSVPSCAKEHIRLILICRFVDPKSSDTGHLIRFTLIPF